MLFLDRVEKTARISSKLTMPPDSGAWPAMTVADIEDMADPQGRPVEALGKKQISGQDAVGVRFPYGDEETLEVWRATATGRPVLIEQFETKGAARPHPLHIIYSDIVFDVPLDDSLFALEVPAEFRVLPGDDVGFNPATRPAAPPQVGFAPLLQFRIVAEPGDQSDADEMVDPGHKQPVRVLRAIELDERDIARAYESKDQTGRLTVGIDFTDAGAKKLEKLTAANIHHRLAIVFKGSLLSAPMIQTAISKSAVISPGGDGFTVEQCQGMIAAINASAWRRRGVAARPPDDATRCGLVARCRGP